MDCFDKRSYLKDDYKTAHFITEKCMLKYAKRDGKKYNYKKDESVKCLKYQILFVEKLIKRCWGAPDADFNKCLDKQIKIMYGEAFKTKNKEEYEYISDLVARCRDKYSGADKGSECLRVSFFYFKGK